MGMVGAAGAIPVILLLAHGETLLLLAGQDPEVARRAGLTPRLVGPAGLDARALAAAEVIIRPSASSMRAKPGLGVLGFSVVRARDRAARRSSLQPSVPAGRSGSTIQR